MQKNNQTKFKETEIGSIPEEWSFDPLEKHADIIMGQSPESTFYNKIGDGLSFLQGIRTFGEKYPTFDTWTTKVTKLAKDKSVLLSVRAPVGEVNLASRDICIGRGLMAINANNNEFIYQLFKAFKGHVVGKETGTVYGSVTRNDIAKLKFPFPPENEQKQIAEILSSLDDKIELNRKINANLEKLASSLFKQWFVDFEFPNESGKPYKSSSGKMLDSELGEIPEGWEADDFGKIINEKTDRFSKIYKDIVVLSAVNTGELVRSEDYFNKQVFSKSLEKYKVVDKFNFAYNPSRINIGSIGMLEEDFQGAVSPIYIVFKPKDEYQYFIQNMLRLDFIKEYIKQFSSGSVRQALSFKDFSSIPVVIPPIKIINKFNDFEISLKKVRQEKELEIKTLEKIRNSLLPRLMSGKIRVK